MKEAIAVRAVLLSGSGLVWALSLLLHEALVPLLSVAPGIDLVFLPSGVRFLCLLVGGRWAAAGISIASFALANAKPGVLQPAPVAAVSVLAGFGPLLAIWIASRALGITADLRNLASWHLPMLSLAAALVSAVLHHALSVSLGQAHDGPWPARITAMVMGDFIGSLIVIILVLGSLRLLRRMRATFK